MLRKSIKYIIGLLIGFTFLWLAVRNIDIARVWGYVQNISWGWVVPFIAVTLIAHFLRAERWKLLIEKSHINSQRSTLFAGIMMGYVVNYVVPRLGEVSRCVYVGKKDNLKATQLIGTVILERVMDLLFLIGFLFVLFFYVINDPETIRTLFGDKNVDRILSMDPIQTGLLGLLALGLGVGGYVVMKKILERWVKQSWSGHAFAEKLLEFIQLLINGFTSFRHLKRWPYFMLNTFGIWILYVLMTYLPLYMFDMPAEYNLNLFDAAVVMIISAIGVSLPSPGGIGTYHWFTQQALVVLYGVDEVTALAYAFVTHAFMLIVVVGSTPIIVFINNLLLNRADKEL